MRTRGSPAMNTNSQTSPIDARSTYQRECTRMHTYILQYMCYDCTESLPRSHMQGQKPAQKHSVKNVFRRGVRKQPCCGRKTSENKTKPVISLSLSLRLLDFFLRHQVKLLLWMVNIGFLTINGLPTTITILLILLLLKTNISFSLGVAVCLTKAPVPRPVPQGRLQN